jgi:hypothetical protein
MHEEENENNIKVVNGDVERRTKLLNHHMRTNQDDNYIIIRGPIKLDTDWCEKLLLTSERHKDSLISPIIHSLDLASWSAETGRYKTTTLGMDLSMRDRPNDNGIDTVVCSSYCMCIPKSVIEKIGYFDEAIEEGYGEDVEYSLRHLAAGGRNVIDKSVIVSTEMTIESPARSKDNKARIAELYLKHRADLIYESIKSDRSTAKIGKLDTTRTQWLSSKDFIQKHLPHLGCIYDLKNSAYGKRISLINAGKSIDYIDTADIMASDLIIGIDGAALLYDCDYAITDNVHMVARLREKYATDKLIISDVLENRLAGEYVSADEVDDVKYRFERLRKGIMPAEINPPFCDVNCIALTALHICLFMNPTKVTMYGFDTHLINGKSHTERSEIYGDGKLMPDTEATEKSFALAELGASCLSKIALKHKIPVVRVIHL